MYFFIVDEIAGVNPSNFRFSLLNLPIFIKSGTEILSPIPNKRNWILKYVLRFVLYALIDDALIFKSRWSNFNRSFLDVICLAPLDLPFLPRLPEPIWSLSSQFMVAFKCLERKMALDRLAHHVFPEKSWGTGITQKISPCHAEWDHIFSDVIYSAWWAAIRCRMRNNRYVDIETRRMNSAWDQ